MFVYPQCSIIDRKGGRSHQKFMKFKCNRNCPPPNSVTQRNCWNKARELLITSICFCLFSIRVVSRQIYASFRSLPNSDKNSYCQNKIEKWELQNLVELSVIDTFALCLNLSYWKNISPQIIRGFIFVSISVPFQWFPSWLARFLFSL